MSANVKSPISQIQKRKLIELMRGIRGDTEADAISHLEKFFNDAFKHGMGEASYEEGARMTAQLLTEQRNGEHLAQPASIPCPECGGIAPAHASTCTFGKSIEHLPTAKLAPTAPAPAAAQTPAAAPVVELPESPYSWNLHAEAPDGWDEQFTLRSSDSKEFIDRIEGLKKYLSSHGYKPAARNAGRGRMNESASGDSEEVPLCAIHHKPMQKRQSKQGGFFYSCHEKLEDGSWCPYKPSQKS